MDRRQIKTRAAIFGAFGRLLQNNHFHNITVKQIIDEANIGRSTFYAHFETKEALLQAMCSNIFDHIISEEFSTEKSHDFSDSNNELHEVLAHILYHLKDEKDEITRLLLTDSESLFLNYFRECVKEIFTKYASDTSEKIADIPNSFRVDFLTASFIESVRWWIAGDMENTPEEIAAFYIKLIAR